MIDLLLKNGKIVSPHGIFTGDIAIDGGKIVGLSGGSSPRGSVRTIDVEGKYVMPGIIDPHVHMLGGTHQKTFAENCRNETKSMIMGGVTSILAFLTKPTPYEPIISSCISDVPDNSYVDIAFHLVINTQEQLEKIEQYSEVYGIKSFKFFTAGAREEIYPDMNSLDDGQFFTALRKIAKLGYPAIALVHPENHEIASALRKELISQGRRDQRAWLDSRPNICEEDSIRRAILLANDQHCPLYLVHVSIENGPAIIRQAKSGGQNVTGESVIHYLTFTIHDKFSVLGKCNPPLRLQEDVEALWKGIFDGSISCIGSDHIPNRSRTTLNEPGGDIWTAKGVYPGSGLILPVMLNWGVHQRGLPIERVVQLCSLNPAKCFGLYPRKGAIIPGSDADLVVVDLKKKFRPSPENLQLGSDFTWYERIEFKGWPTLTIKAGKIVVEDMQIVSENRSAEYVRR